MNVSAMSTTIMNMNIIMTTSTNITTATSITTITRRVRTVA